MKFSSLRTIFALAAEHDLEVHQMDIKAAYLNTDLDKEIYMEVPPGFNISDGHILRLKKGVYGMKQGGHVWYIISVGCLPCLATHLCRWTTPFSYTSQLASLMSSALT